MKITSILEAVAVEEVPLLATETSSIDAACLLFDRTLSSKAC
jgi:hypothetical protein